MGAEGAEGYEGGEADKWLEGLRGLRSMKGMSGLWAEEAEGADGADRAEGVKWLRGLTGLMLLLYIYVVIWLKHHGNRLSLLESEQNGDWAGLDGYPLDCYDKGTCGANKDERKARTKRRLHILIPSCSKIIGKAKTSFFFSLS